MILLFVGFVFSDSVIAELNRRSRILYRDNEECFGIHTVLTSDKKCICQDGYTNGNPDEEGCYKCQEDCHPNGSCTFPGLCNCNLGFYGDGVYSCVIPKPVIQDSPFGEYSGQIGNEIILYYKPFYHFYPLKGFCKFEDVSYQALQFNNLYISCMIPKTLQKETNLSISFDEESWSDVVQLIIKSRPSLQMHLFFVYVFISFFIVLLISYFICSKTMMSKDKSLSVSQMNKMLDIPLSEN